MSKPSANLEAYAGCGVIVLVMSLLIGTFSVKAIGGLNIPYSEGTRSGVVQKFSKKGMVWNTWEGEMNMGYSTQTNEGQIRPVIWYFSCSSPEAAKQIQDAEKTGKRVTLKYSQYWFRGYKYGATEYDVTGVEAAQ